ncbi:hypothetical protein [Mucilaginibacter auburnensis]|uniref:Uncharacterized protein n=1 Tax=Mucilaginibacter auburnensis TaxID=1457233 RepID=A0A2H9VP02_9SPHI|nr:hypothetical protein [Mucilaginibacter auburnensis]PJJ80033.1 hypothetical protein CLV57_3177 [Mucilaginibacter auburnensis]
MKDFIDTFKDWVVDLGDKHGVDPALIFFLYLFSKVGLFSFLGWGINNIRRKRPFILPLTLAGVAFCIPYTYLIIAGRNIPVWVYVIIAAVFVLGLYSIWRKISIKAN